MALGQFKEVLMRLRLTAGEEDDGNTELRLVSDEFLDLFLAITLREPWSAVLM